MSMSSNALVTGRQPPWLLPAVSHCALNDVIELTCIVAHRAEHRVSYRRGDGRRLCLPVPLQGIEDHVILALKETGPHPVVHVTL
jgi:hypothetical protein